MPREIPDHPDIAFTLLTGYPRPDRFARCADCGREFYGEERLYISDGDLVCDECLMDRILEAYGAEDLAKELGIDYVTVEDVLKKAGESL